MTRIAFLVPAAAVTLAALSPAPAQTPKPWHEANVPKAEAWTQAQTKRAADQTNLWVRPGIVADRGNRTVEVLAEATGLEAGAIAEFLLVGQNSEKDYEALAISFAGAGDVARGLAFIGLPAGKPVDAAARRFWAKGERVRIAVRPPGGDANSSPITAFFTDKREGRRLPDSFVFTGSRPGPGAQAGALAADGPAPGGIVSTYNEPTTVLDVPTAAPQGEVYGSMVIDRARAFRTGELVLFVLTPEPRPDGTRRVCDVTLAAGPAAGTNAPGLAGVACVTASADGALPAATNGVQAALERLEALAKSGRDPFVALALCDALTAGAARDLARVLKAVEGEGGIRVDPPPDGQLYFRAFLPDEKWRSRRERFAQPWELRVGRSAEGAWKYTLVQVLEDWSKEGQLDPDLTVKEHPLARQEDLPARIRELGGGINTLFIFAPADAPLASFLTAVRASQAALPTVYVFVE
jgi:hypothetical protein